jgi:drug/metabolite transporter (DMT)-like permease
MPVVVLSAVFCCVLWGSASPAIKIAYDLFKIEASDTASRLMLSGARFVIAGIMVIIFGSLLGRKTLIPKRSSWKYIVILSLFQTIGQYYFFFMSLANTSGVRGSIINASGNFLAIIMAALVFRLEKITPKKLLGCIVGFSGIFLIIGGFEGLGSGSVTFRGEGAMVIADLFYSLANCSIKIFSKYENTVVLSGYQFLLGGIILSLIGLCLGGRLSFYSPWCFPILLYLGFVSAGAFTIWGILLFYNPVSRISIFGFMNPVIGVFLSALLLGESNEAFSITGLLALALVSLGIFIVNFSKRDSIE